MRLPCWQRYGTRGIAHHPVVGTVIGKPLWGSLWQPLEKWAMCMPDDLPKLLFGIFSGETCVCAQEHLLQHFCDNKKMETMKCLNKVMEKRTVREKESETLGMMMRKQ